MTRLHLAVVSIFLALGVIHTEAEPVIRLATGRNLVRVVIILDPHPEHRALLVSGAITDDEENVTWERTSGEQLEGSDSPRTHTFEWTLPKADPFTAGARTLNVRAAVICESAASQSYIP